MQGPSGRGDGGSADHGTNGNFGFLAGHDPVFLELAASAERAFSFDPNTTLIKLRQLGEAMAQDIAVRLGIEQEECAGQRDLLSRIDGALGLDPTVRELFHTLRIEGYKATHQFRTQHREAIRGLKVARSLAVWFHRAFGDPDFKAGAFRPPEDPSHELRDLQTEMDRLRGELASATEQADAQRKLAELEAREKQEYAELAEAMDEEARGLAEASRAHQAEQERREREFQQRLEQARTQQQPERAAEEVSRPQLRQANQALNAQLGLDEELTRLLIDQLFAFADQVEQQVKNAQARVKKLTQSILAKAFRGELTAEWRARKS